MRLRGPGHGTRGEPAASSQEHDHETSRAPGRVLILSKVPPGSVRIRGWDIERQYLDVLTGDPRYLELRTIARINTMRVAKYLARRASYTDGTTRRGGLPWWQLAGICSATWKAVRRRLEEWGYLGVVEHGTTPEFRPMALMRGGRNQAALYVLCVPRDRRNHPASPQVRPQTQPPTQSGRTDVGSPVGEQPVENRETPDGPGSARAALLRAMAETIRKAAGQYISDKWCARIAGRFAAAGWTARDLAWAIEHEPGGARHGYTQPVRHPAGWARERLRQHTDGHGVLLSRSQQAAVRRQRDRADRAHRQAITAGLAAVWTDPAPAAAGIRAKFGWKGL